MTSRTLPNLGLKAFFSFGEDGWNDEVDQNFLKLSTLCQSGAINIVTTLPSSPTQGDIYLISPASQSNPNGLAVFDGGTWTYYAPRAGWMIFNQTTDSYVVFDGDNWQTVPLARLVSLTGINNSAGILEQTGANTFTKRDIGIGSAASLLTRNDGDTRYAEIGHTHPSSGVTTFNGRAGTVSLSDSDVTSALTFVPEPSNAKLAAIRGLDVSSGLLEQTGANTFSKRVIGVDIATILQSDARYQPLSLTLSSLDGLPSDSGTVEQYAPNAFRLRPIGLVDIRSVTASTTITAADIGGHLRVNTSSPSSVSIPANSATLPIGCVITVVQAGTGEVLFNPEPEVVLDFPLGKANKTTGWNTTLQLMQYAANKWLLIGQFETAIGSSSDTISWRADTEELTADYE